MPPITFGQLPLTAFNPIHEKKLSFLRAVKNHQRKGRREKIMTWKITSDSMDKSFIHFARSTEYRKNSISVFLKFLVVLSIIFIPFRTATF